MVTLRLERQTVVRFIAESPWGRQLTAAQLERVLATSRERSFAKNCAIVAAGTHAAYWVGIIDGFGVQSVTHADGHVSFLSAGGEGTWFGEGTLMKRGIWGYDAMALRETRVAIVPLATFEWLRNESLPFNHFLQTLMNDRLSSSMGSLVSARHATTEGRIATALINLFNLAIYTRHDTFVRVSQGELALLAGTSRPRTNDALRKLHERKLVEPRRQGILVLDLEGLKAIPSERSSPIDPVSRTKPL